jgi:2-keto-4-pentenoate hydratase
MLAPSRTVAPYNHLMSTRLTAGAQHLLESHRKRAVFAPLPQGLAPTTIAEAYAMQDAFVAGKIAAAGAAVAGYKIALTTQAMRTFTGFSDSIGGTLIDTQIFSSPARIRAADYVRLIIESEIAFEIGTDVRRAPQPYDGASVGRFVSAAMPAFEIADDRGADYARLATDILSLIADNAWNEGAVFGASVRDWATLDMAALHGVVEVNGVAAGEGFGRDVLGHPLEALAWIANQLIDRGLMLRRGQRVITGSLVVSKFLKAGDTVRFTAGALGTVELAID